MLAVLGPACYTTTGKIAGGIAGVSGELAGLAVVHPRRNCSSDECDLAPIVNFVGFGAIAAIAGIVALVAERNYHSPAPAPAPSPAAAVWGMEHQSFAGAAECGVAPGNLDLKAARRCLATFLLPR